MTTDYQFADLLLPLSFDHSLSYSIPKGMNLVIGDLVQAPLRGKNICGVVTKLTEHSHLEAKQIKSIVCQDIRIRIKPALLEFINWVANYNLAHRGAVLKLAISILNSSKEGRVNKKQSIKSIDKQENQEIDLNSRLKILSPSQAQAAELLNSKIDQQQHSITLLDGVTGSGKTEVYFTAIAKILTTSRETKGQVLILLPEIALTSQLVERFYQQFGFIPQLWHSKISNSKKRQIFYGLADGSNRVLIGTRSALFLPFKNLRLIVVDEEHDPSFKQEDVVNYNGRDMAIVRAKIEQIPIILSSATPSIETYLNAQNGKYQQVCLADRFGQEEKTIIKLVDMRREKLTNNQHISLTLKQELAANLANNRQSMLFLNRRGYAPLTLCKSCGHKINCPNCSTYSTYHQKSKRLICHQCGHSTKILAHCPCCQASDSLICCGAGVEKIQEEILQYFPNARTSIITSDSVTSVDMAEKIIKPILNNQIDIIIGTQMIAKGHHFPFLSLVGVIDGDSSFYNANLRTAERSYQLLTQVIGRAGREKYQGQVILQTYNPDNLIFQNIISGNRDQFLKIEAKNREIMEMPPFTKMAAIIFSSLKEDLVIKTAKNVLKEFCQIANLEIFGPAPMPIARVKNRYHYRLTLRTNKKVNLQKIISNTLFKINIPSTVIVKIDIDPNN